MTGIPHRWKDPAGWQGYVAGSVNPLLQGYLWNQYAAAPSPDPNDGYSYYDLTKHSPGWFNGTAFRYPVGADGSGNVTIAGTLGVTGATTLSSLSTSGNATVGGTLGVTGATTLAGLTATSATVSGATQLNTLAVNAITGSGSITTTGAIGYRTGAGGSVTQGTSRTTGVTLNKLCGSITLFSAAGSTSWQTFTVSCNQVDAVDTVILSQKSGTDDYMLHVTRVAANAFDITFATTGGTTSEQPVFNFAVLKAVVA